MKKTAAVLISSILLALLLTACSNIPTEEREGVKEVNLLFNFAASSLDLHVDTSYVPVRAGITETLVYLNGESLEVEPWLSTEQE